MDAILKYAKMDDIKVIRTVIDETPRMEMTLQNAQIILAKGLKRKPEGWTITMDELPELWAEYEAVKLAA